MSGTPAKARSSHDSLRRKEEDLNPAPANQGLSSSKLRSTGSVDAEDLDDPKTRNHSLKYSKGALTGNTHLVHFDDKLVSNSSQQLQFHDVPYPSQLKSMQQQQQQLTKQQAQLTIQQQQQNQPQQQALLQQQQLQQQVFKQSSHPQPTQQLQQQQPHKQAQQSLPQQNQVKYLSNFTDHYHQQLPLQQQQQHHLAPQTTQSMQKHNNTASAIHKVNSYNHIQPHEQHSQHPISNQAQHSNHQQQLHQHNHQLLHEPMHPSQNSQVSVAQIQPVVHQQAQHLHQHQQSRKHDLPQKMSSPVLDRKAGLTRKVLLNNCAKHASVDFPASKEVYSLPKRAQSMRVTPLLRVMGREAGSGSLSPMSSPSPSSDEEEARNYGSSPVRIPKRHRTMEKFGSLERSASSSYKTSSNLSPNHVVRSSSYSKIIQISRHKRDLPDQDPGTGPSDSEGEEYRRRRLQMTSSMKIRGHVTKNDSLEVPGSSPDGSTHRLACTPPGVPMAMHSIRRDSFDVHQVKSRSLVCLAAATAAEIAGHPLLADHARSGSYLSGNSSASSILRSDELDRYFPDRKLRLFVGSWNMNGQTPPAYLADFLLPQHIEYVPDLLVVGTQECLSETKEWEARLQGTLGPSHVMFHSHSLGTLHLAVFIRRDLIWFCSIPEVDSFSTRPTATFKTKGAVAIAFILFGTSFLFVNSHLTAHQENVKDRVKDLKKINAMLSLPRTLPIKKKYHDLADNFDCSFWCGDLNFRLEQTREVVIREVKDGTSILDFDQLNYLKNEGLIFNGYVEDPIKFAPTYKYDPGTNNFDTSSKQRVPSYTDRILYKSQKSSPITPLHYDSVRDVLTSDHRPVWGMWETVIRPGKESIPLSGGLFNREIYLEGLKRRSEALKPASGGRMSVNSMCNLQ